ncbi:STAS domain-containing protein [Halalkalibacterium ligniniphilum]|uniref:STAS domain-containing protein n=1 Tax=Halalkalibacterium ligniniphilum TaxID=1134413 RepID=UPI0003498736|nr:STAS domain-containing protein [Halalkalibacterium ligniniphilum]
MNLDIRQEQKGEAEYLFLIGEIDAYTAPKLRDHLIPLITESKGRQVIVDLSDVQYIDSTGLGIFIGALKAAHTHESTLKLVGVTERVQRLFKITGLDEVMDMDNQREEAK